MALDILNHMAFFLAVKHNDDSVHVAMEICHLLLLLLWTIRVVLNYRCSIKNSPRTDGGTYAHADEWEQMDYSCFCVMK